MLSAYLKPMGELVAKRWIFAKAKNSQKIVCQPVRITVVWLAYLGKICFRISKK
jgi:hypothetical protein